MASARPFSDRETRAHGPDAAPPLPPRRRAADRPRRAAGARGRGVGDGPGLRRELPRQPAHGNHDDRRYRGRDPRGHGGSVASELAGDAWSADCPGTVSGSRWYAITAISGVTTTSLYGVSPVYAAKGLFQAANTLEGIDVSTLAGHDQLRQGRRIRQAVRRRQGDRGHRLHRRQVGRQQAGGARGRPAVTGYHFARPDLNPTDAVRRGGLVRQPARPRARHAHPDAGPRAHGSLSVAAAQAWVAAPGSDAVYAKTGVRPMIYTSPSFWQTYSVQHALSPTTATPSVGRPLGRDAARASRRATGAAGLDLLAVQRLRPGAGHAGCVDLDRYNGLDLTSMTFGADVSVHASPASRSIEQGAGAHSTSA